MPAVAAMIYLLLALRVRISLEGTICGAGGSLSLIAGAAGMYIRFDGEITRKKDAYTLLLVPRYRKGRMQKKMKRTRSKPMNIVRTYLWFARAGKIEWLTADVRIGLGAAGETAAAAGILQALASALLLHAGHGAAVQLRVQPDFNHASFAAHAHCIFSCQSGDIILEAIRFALKKKKKIAGERDRVGKASH